MEGAGGGETGRLSLWGRVRCGCMHLLTYQPCVSIKVNLRWTWDINNYWNKDLYRIFTYAFENFNSFGGHLFQLPIHSCSYMISFGKTGIWTHYHFRRCDLGHISRYHCQSCMLCTVSSELFQGCCIGSALPRSGQQAHRPGLVSAFV